jgi:PKD repeat protein/subtilisin family serine protease
VIKSGVAMSKYFAPLLICTLSYTTTLSQNPYQGLAKLKALSLEADSIRLSHIRKIQEYTQMNNVPVSYRDANGDLVLMVGISDSGLPLYETTDNAGAAITTGAVKLRLNGGMGLNLEGQGMEVGVWDGGVINNHLEFDDRILLREGSAEDNHATHVTGTIIASGVNPDAKGMVPKAKVYAYDFSNDVSEMIGMARPDQSGLALSNHSYGLITGWRFNNGWQWFGDQSISAQEDWKFGFYSSAARQWDQISVNAPYYLIIKSAGNDRTDTGNGNFPPDCNGGSGYDCIADKSTAKNILTVGAVSKTLSYTSPSSVAMSSFSCWGPTDDGRIKPDLVAAGVNLLSTFGGASNNNYGTLSGTSMSTPNVTGSLALLQELHRNLNSGNLMKAATLKAIAIHSTKEAGPSPGPDYQFGWGLLDVEAGAKLLLNEDKQNILIIEETLRNNQVYEVKLNPQSNKKITVTLVWNDPAGNPVGPTLDPTNLMLVNDLDVKVIDDAGNAQFPWILNPAVPDQPASKGNNIRDNVEKLEFDEPEPRSYRLLVNHKGLLSGGAQDFSLVIEYTSTADPRPVLYWVGNNGSWDNPNNWSLSSGGLSENVVPTIEYRVVVDENSFNSSDRLISLPSNASCHSLTWLTKAPSGILMNNKTLEISNNLTLSSSNFRIESPGIFRFSNDLDNTRILNLGENDLSKSAIKFNSEKGQWSIIGNPSIGEIDLERGSLIFAKNRMSLKKLTARGASSTLDIEGSVITDIEKFDLLDDGLDFFSSDAILKSSLTDVSIYDFGLHDYEGKIECDNEANIGSANFVKEVKLNGKLEIDASLSINKFDVEAGSILTISSGRTIFLTKELKLNSTNSKMITIQSSGAEPASITLDGRDKLCFDNLIIIRVNLFGSAVVNAGTNSSVVSSSGWSKDLCDNVLFPDFDASFLCANSYTIFLDKSMGNIKAWKWDFGLGNLLAVSNDKNPNFTFSNTGTYNVTLTISNENDSRSYKKSIEIGTNPMPANEIVLSNNSLFSLNSASSYNWFRNGAIIDGAKARSILHNGQSGNYFVVAMDGLCNTISPVFVITSLMDRDDDFLVYPNPAKKVIFLTLPTSMVGSELTVYDFMGNIQFRKHVVSSNDQLNLENWKSGLYLFLFRKDELVVSKKVIVE